MLNDFVKIILMIDTFSNIMINFYKTKTNFDRDKSSVCTIIFTKGKQNIGKLNFFKVKNLCKWVNKINYRLKKLKSNPCVNNFV